MEGPSKGSMDGRQLESWKEPLSFLCQFSYIRIITNVYMVEEHLQINISILNYQNPMNYETAS